MFVLTALMGVPYGVVSTASNQGMYVSARPQERGVAAGIFQTCRYLGAITATVLIGVLYGERREPGELGPDGDRHAGAGRRRVRRDAAVAGAEMSQPERENTAALRRPISLYSWHIDTQIPREYCLP